MDLEKLARDIKELLKVGELNYEGPCSGEVQEQANKAAKDAEKAVSVVPAVQSLDILEKVVVIDVTNESDVELEILKQSFANCCPCQDRTSGEVPEQGDCQESTDQQDQLDRPMLGRQYSGEDSRAESKGIGRDSGITKITSSGGRQCAASDTDCHGEIWTSWGTDRYISILGQWDHLLSSLD